MFETTILSVYRSDSMKVLGFQGLPIDFRVAENIRQRKDQINDLLKKYPTDFVVHEMNCSRSMGAQRLSNYKKLASLSKFTGKEPPVITDVNWIVFYIYQSGYIKKGIPKRLPYRFELCNPEEVDCMIISIKESQRVRETKQAVLMFDQKGKPEWL